MARSYVHEARRRVGPKRGRIVPIIERLRAEHADAAIALTFRSPLELLVSVMLSAQTTDVTVNLITPLLFTRFPDARAMAEADTAELEAIIKPTGFFRAKTRNLLALANRVVLEALSAIARRRRDTAGGTPWDPALPLLAERNTP